MAWEQIHEMPTLRNMVLRDYHTRQGQGQDGVAFGPYSAAFWTDGTGEKPGPQDGVVAVHPTTGEYLAVWDADGMARASTLTGRGDTWNDMANWDEVRNGMSMFVTDIDADLSDGVYIVALPSDIDSRYTHAPAFLLQQDGKQELWQAYNGWRRFRRTISTD